MTVMPSTRESYAQCSIPLGEVEPTVGAMLEKRAVQFHSHVVFKERKADGHYHGLEWGEFYRRVRNLGSSLLSLGVKKGEPIAVYSANNEEMLLWELAVMSIGAISVPIFSGYPPAQLSYVLQHCAARMILIPDSRQLEQFYKASCADRLRTIVLARGMGPAEDRRVIAFNDLLRAPSGDAFDAAVGARHPHDPCLIMYTSGTTGDPKGVVLTHRNILSQQKALSLVWDVGPGDVFLSYLPWHHSFGGLFERFTALASGATLCVDDGLGRDLGRLVHNWKEIQPTLFFSVPKIFQALVREARRDAEVDRCLFHRSLRFVFTAAAPLPTACADYFAQKGVEVLEGWGLTETSPCVTMTRPGVERVPSVVGQPIPGVEMRVSEDRELFVRGPNVMQGYYRDKEGTEQAIDAQGWFRTGDLGELTPPGLRLICRRDGLFKLTNGEKVPSMMVENSLVSTSHYVDHALAVGTGKAYVAALLFPNVRNLQSWAVENGLHGELEDHFFHRPEVLDLFREEVEEQNLRLGPGYLRVKAFAVVPQELTLERGELTPSMKVCRCRVLEQCEDLVKAIYHEGYSDPYLENRIVRLAMN